jgi:hypothetical protein
MTTVRPGARLTLAVALGAGLLAIATGACTSGAASAQPGRSPAARTGPAPAGTAAATTGTGSAPAGSTTAGSGGTWSAALAITPTQKSDSFGGDIASVSCPSAGNCAAAGSVLSDEDTWGVVVNEVNGKWGGQQSVASLDALTTGAGEALDSVSCWAPGDCLAVGYVTAQPPGIPVEHREAALATEANGTWGGGMVVPGHGARHAFIATRSASGGKATWQAARPLSGLSGITAVSCGAAGSCAAVQGAHVATMSSGTWGSARTLAAASGLPAGGTATLLAVSCGSAGNCAAGGGYQAGQQARHAVVAIDRDGTWGPVTPVPGVGGAPTFTSPQVTAVACAPGGALACTAVGGYLAPHSAPRLFTDSYSGGRWAGAAPLAGVPALLAAAQGLVSWDATSVSCPSAGNCGLAGYFRNAPLAQVPAGFAFVATSANGTWGPAIRVRDPGGAEDELTSVSCPRPGSCRAVGDSDGNGGLLVEQAPAR